MHLKDTEIRLINELRAKRAVELKHGKLKRRALQVAYKYECWLTRQGQGDAYSTFVNSFGYQENDSREMHRIVGEIIAAAADITVSGQPAYEVLTKNSDRC